MIPQVTIDNEYDVIVLGGGPSGVTAATAAAREGRKTLLIEQTGCLGGMATAGLVTVFAPFSDGERIVYGGLAEKILCLNRDYLPHVPPNQTRWVQIDPENLKRICDTLVTESGCDILFFTTMCGAVMKDSRNVDYIFTANKKGITSYRGKIYIDCTGDGDLAAWAGGEFVKGDEGGELQPVTLCFTLANVDTYSYLNSPDLHPSNVNSIIFDILKSGEFPLIPDSHLCNHLIGPGLVGFNAGHIWNIDGTNPYDLSKAVIEGRKIANELATALKKYDPATYGNAVLAATAPLVGTRESRRIVGSYTLTKEDYGNRTSFPDEISRGCYYIDIHIKQDEAKAGYSAFKNDYEGKYGRYGLGESYGIPYRCLTPKDLDNVLVAGKTISCDRMMQGSVRVIPSCMAMGEGAGIAAAMAAEADRSIHSIDTDILREKIMSYGGYIK